MHSFQNGFNLFFRQTQNFKTMIYSNKDLSQKLERTEARTNADFVETRAKMFPESRAEWIEVGGAYAMFDSPESPLTQTFGLGLFDEITDTELESLEDFFRQTRRARFSRSQSDG